MEVGKVHGDVIMGARCILQNQRMAVAIIQ